MIKSSQSRKQRKFRFNAPLHARQHFMHAHVDKSLREKFGIKYSNIGLAKGDTVKIMAGASSGKSGKVTLVNMKSGKIYLDGLTRKNARGKEFNIPISPSNVYIVDLDTTGHKGRLEKLQGAAPRVSGVVQAAAKAEKK